MTDENIVNLYFERDERAISETKDKYEPYLTKIAFNILSDAEDSRESVNDTYLAAWNSMPPHKPSRLSVYLGKLARRISIDCFRKRNTQKRSGSQYTLSLDELGECCADGSTPERELDAKRLGELLNIFLGALSKEHRAVFIGRYYYLDTLKEVAAYCGISESKAKSILFRDRKRLKEFLTKEGYSI